MRVRAKTHCAAASLRKVASICVRKSGDISSSESKKATYPSVTARNPQLRAAFAPERGSSSKQVSTKRPAFADVQSATRERVSSVEPLSTTISRTRS